MQTRTLALHALRYAGMCICIGIGDAHLREGPGYAALLVFGCSGFFFSCFALSHDAMHGALGLSKRAHDVILALAAAPMLLSGHAIQLLHMRHHAHPLGPDDVEGSGATVGLARAIALGPSVALATRTVSWRIAPQHRRAWLVAEHAGSALVATLLIASGRPSALLAVGVALGLQLTMPVWGAHIPHRVPDSVRRLAAKLSWTRSVSMVNLAYHDAHHRHPRIPCDQLPSAAR